MEKTKTFSVSEAALSIIASVLTVVDIFYRGCVLLLKKSVSLLFQLACILMFAAVIILFYLIVMIISTAMGPWLNTHIQ